MRAGLLGWGGMMPRGSQLFASCLLFVWTADSSWLQARPVQSLGARYNDAIQQFQAGNFSEACGRAARIVEENPNYYAVYNLLGLCQTQDGNFDSAAVHFRMSIQLNPRFVDARVNLAVNRAHRGDLQEGMRQFSEALKLEPANLTALFNLGKLQLLARRTDEAVKHLLQASKLAQKDVAIRLSLAEAYLASSRKEAAKEVVAKILRERHPANVNLSAAVLALGAGDETLGRQGLQKALQGDVQIEAKVLGLARKASEEKRYDLSWTLLAAVESTGGTSPEWNALQGYNHYKLGDPEKALVLLQRAVNLEPTNEDYYLKMGELMLFHNSDHAAQAFFEAGLEVLPNSALLHYGLAVSCLNRNANLKKLQEHVQAALKLQPSFEPALKLLCVALRQQSDWNRLREESDRLIQLHARSPAGYFFKAVSMIEAGPIGGDRSQTGEAAQLLRHSIMLDPEDSEPRVALGKLLIGLDQTAEAISELEKATSLSPDSTEAYFQLAKAYRKAGLEEKYARAISDFKRLEAEQQARGTTGWLALFQVKH